MPVGLDRLLTVQGLQAPGFSRQDGDAGCGRCEDSDSGTAPRRRVKVRKQQPLGAEVSPEDRAAMSRRIAEIIPGIADLSVTPDQKAAALRTAEEIRLERFRQDRQLKTELRELQDIYDMSKPNAVDFQLPAEGEWKQQIRPKPRKIELSAYECEMINYQRMLMRKNRWYYRDRMSVPRGPCPLHVLKECWVQGVIDENTLVWGHGLYDWLPVKNVKLLTAMIRTPEVRFAAWFKRTFSLKPALERIRETRRQFRDPDSYSMQVERMR